MIHPEEPESEPLQEFLASGGDIVEFDEHGWPRRWICGKDGDGRPTDPPGIERRDILHRLDAAGRYEGVIPQTEDIEELKRWRSDWNDPV